MNSALLIVDYQNDFCPGGPLAVPDADEILPILNGLIRAFRRVFLTQEWHPRGHLSFASSHRGRHPFDRIVLPEGEQILWPDHCIEDTAGAAFHPGLDLPADAVVVRKGTEGHRDGYSAFLGHDRSASSTLDALLRRHAIGEIVLCGLATDFCVLRTAIDARSLGYEVTVVESACRAIDLEGSLSAAWKRMTEAGVRRA